MRDTIRTDQTGPGNVELSERLALAVKDLIGRVNWAKIAGPIVLLLIFAAKISAAAN